MEERKFTQRTAISHAFALLDVRPAEKEKLYQRLATHQTAIMSTIPYDPRYLLPPIDVLRQTGVSVHLGSDGFLTLGVLMFQVIYLKNYVIFVK